MKKKLFSIAFIGLFSQIDAQNTGINTTNPKATLDINAKTDASTQPEGILIPRLTGDQVRLMPIANLQESTMVYATSASSDLTATKDKNLTEKGYFYWDGAAWQNVISNDWKVIGNTGTNPNVNFIGTKDNTDLHIKVNNVESGLININRSNTSFGYSTFSQFYPNDFRGNNAFGTEALKGAITASYNTAIGNNSLYQNKTGWRNVAVGHYANSSNINANDNVSIGGQANGRTDGSGNTAIGSSANSNNEISSESTVIGFRTGYNSSGSNNILLGSKVTTIPLINSNYMNLGNAIFGKNINDGTYSFAVFDFTDLNLGNDLIGIATPYPTNTLHVYSTANPVRLEGLQNSTDSADRIVVADASGVLKTRTVGSILTKTTYDVTASRTTNTNYTNTLDRPKKVIIIFDLALNGGSVGSTTGVVYVNGLAFGNGVYQSGWNIHVINIDVEPGDNYRMVLPNSTGGISKVFEKY